MTICIGYASALEVYRAHGRLLPDLLEGCRTSKLGKPLTPTPQMLEDSMNFMGAKTKPYHLVFGSQAQTHARPDIVRHVYSGDLPRNAFIRAKGDVLIASPEFLFVQLASQKDLSDVELVQIGYELCGTYILDPVETMWAEPIRNATPMTNVRKIKGMLGKLGGRWGARRAERLLSQVREGSNSPMETILALLLCLPRRLGGLGLGPVVMNKRVSTSTGERWVDLFFPEHGVGVEYKGRESHSIEKVGRDDRRQNKLVGSGVSVLNVWYEDLVDPLLFRQLQNDIAHAMGVRLRIRSEGFERRQSLLRAEVLPIAKRYGGFTA